MSLLVFLFVVECLSRASSNAQEIAKCPIFVSHIAASSNDFSGAQPAVQLALEHINTNSTLLSGYTLNFTNFVETKCDQGTSLRDFVSSTRLKNQTTIASLCCGCSTATEVVAEISSMWNVAQISYTYGSIDTNTDYKRVFQTIPSSYNFPFAVLSLMRWFNWRRVAFVTQNESCFWQISEQFQQLTESESIMTLNPVFSSAEDVLLTIANKGFKIIVLNCYSQVAKMVICEASKRNMFDKEYVWVLHGWYPENWWMNLDQDDCSNYQMMRMLNLSLVIVQQPAPANMTQVTVSGYTPQRLSELYKEQLYGTHYSFSPVGAAAYDAVWTLAIALDKTIMQLKKNMYNNTTASSSISLEVFSYFHDTPVLSLFLQNLRETNFYGASGKVSFNDDGSRNYSIINVAQMISSAGNITETLIGQLSTITEPTLAPIFPNGGFPNDRDICTYLPGLSEVFYALSTLGIGCALICGMFNFLCRNKRVVQLSSPNLNYFIVAGVLIGCCSIFADFLRVTSPSESQAQCIFRDWSLILGYVLAFSTVLAKMWRINYICNNPSPNKEPPKDWHLVVIVASTTGLSVILLLLKTFLPDFRFKPTMAIEQSSQQTKFFYTCSDDQSSSSYGVVMMYACIALLQLVGLYLIYQSKHIASIPSLNETKSVTALIYFSTICFGIIVFIEIQFKGYLNISQSIVGVLYLVLVFLFLGLVFGPKMLAVYKDPSGEMIFTQASSGASSLSANSTVTLPQRSSKLAECNSGYVTGLEARICDLELKLQQALKNNEDRKITEDLK